MLITMEGIEGSGKTTQIRRMGRYLEEMGHECVLTREPGGTWIGAKIRSILLDPDHTDLSPLAELFLYLADRAQHVDESILPLMKTGKTVISDRFHDATVVYQGYARGLDLDMLHGLHDIVLRGLEPDITFLLDLSPAAGLARAWKGVEAGERGREETRFEQEAVAFHEKVRNGYLDLARRNPGRFVVIDADNDPDTVFASIKQSLSERIKKIP